MSATKLANKIQQGFLFYEVILSFSIIAIALSYITDNTLAANITTKNSYNSILNTLQQARLIALTTKQQVIFCPSSNKIDCSNSWREEYTLIKAANKTIMISKLGKDITWQANLTNKQYITLQSSGATHSEQGTLKIGCKTSSSCYHITINFAGDINGSSKLLTK